MRRVTQTVVGTKLALEALPFLFKRGGVEIHQAALCCVPDLGQKVFQLLEQNERQKYTIIVFHQDITVVSGVRQKQKPETASQRSRTFTSPSNPNQRKPFPSCFLETLQKDYKNFIARKKGDLKSTKIPLDDISLTSPLIRYICGRTSFHIYTTSSLIKYSVHGRKVIMVLSNWIACFYTQISPPWLHMSLSILIYWRLTATAWILHMLRVAWLDHQHPSTIF